MLRLKLKVIPAIAGGFIYIATVAVVPVYVPLKAQGAREPEGLPFLRLLQENRGFAQAMKEASLPRVSGPARAEFLTIYYNSFSPWDLG